MADKIKNDNEKQLALTIGNTVRQRRMECDISQSELARRAKMSQSTVSLLESGKFLASFSLLVRITQVLSCSINIDLQAK